MSTISATYDPQTLLTDILRHISAAMVWALPEKFVMTRVHATNRLVRHNREIPEIVRWYIADRLLELTQRLNELLDGRVSSWVDEMRTIRGKAGLSWRILREVNLPCSRSRKDWLWRPTTSFLMSDFVCVGGTSKNRTVPPTVPA